jgi:dienelactone hydrolase
MTTATPRSIPSGATATILGGTVRALIWAALAAMALTSCAMPDIRTKEAEAALDRHVERGYHADRRYATVSARDTWKLGADVVDVTVIMPAGTDRFPLIVYLPGLGESSDAGAAWRRGWAEAGYAVVSLQAASVGPAVWSSELARDGAFRRLAEQEFSATSLARRLTMLSAALAELGRRGDSAADGLYRRIDLSRIAVAGFDLGAQTAMVVAGEQIDGIDSPAWPTAVKAVVTLSPYADFSGMGLERDFKPIRLPVLCVTSFEDTDPYGLVTTAAVRRAPFQYMPDGDKYLLLLSATPHALLSGREAPVPAPMADRADAGNAATPGGSEDRSEGGAGRRGRSFGGGSRASGAASSPHAESSVQWKLQIDNVESVTTAYLDATVKSDRVAQEWLRKDARRWLGKSGEFQFK